MKLLNFGSLNIDYVYDVKNFVRAGETISSLCMEKFCGGKGLNQSIALARSGAKVYHAGMIGEADGQFLLDTLNKSGVDTQFVLKSQGPSGHAIIQHDENGENCIILYGGSNQQITEKIVDDVLANFDNGDFIVLQNEISCLEYIIDKAYEKGMIIVLNPSPMNEKIHKCSLEKVTYFMFNEVEAQELCEINAEPIKMLDALKSKFPDSKFILTLGSKGSIYSDNELTISQGIYKTTVVDTTAAGDTFTGFFLGALSKGINIDECLKIASAASSLAVSRKGASVSIPYWEETLEYKNKK